MKTSTLLGLVVTALVTSFVIAAEPASGPGIAAAEQRGLVLPTWERHGYRDTDPRGALQDIAGVGAGWVQIIPTWYQSAPASSKIAPSDSSVDDADVRQVISLARGEGLKVLLKPHVDLRDGSDRAQIDPADPDAWFQSYHAFITHYAELAQQLGVEEFAVGTELSGVSDDRQRWLAVIEDVRNRYHGPLVYAAHHNEYPAVAFWDALDLIGIDAYWPLSTQPAPAVAQLKHAFAAKRDDLAAFAARIGRPVLFTEAGYSSQVGTAMAPWAAHLSDKPSQEEQADAYEALLATFSGEPWWVGVFWWTWDVQHRYPIDPPAALNHSIRNKLAESVLRKRWGEAPATGASRRLGR